MNPNKLYMHIRLASKHNPTMHTILGYHAWDTYLRGCSNSIKHAAIMLGLGLGKRVQDPRAGSGIVDSGRVRGGAKFGRHKAGRGGAGRGYVQGRGGSIILEYRGPEPTRST